MYFFLRIGVLAELLGQCHLGSPSSDQFTSMVSQKIEIVDLREPDLPWSSINIDITQSCLHSRIAHLFQQISFTTARGHVFCADVAGSPTWLSVADVAKTESIKEFEGANPF